MRAPGMRSAIWETWALYGATIKISLRVSDVASPRAFTQLTPGAIRLSTIAATRSASSIDLFVSVRRIAWSIARDGVWFLRAVRGVEGGSRRSCLVAAHPRAAGRDDRFDGVDLRADTHRGWGIASMARAAARWARFS